MYTIVKLKSGKYLDLYFHDLSFCVGKNHSIMLDKNELKEMLHVIESYEKQKEDARPAELQSSCECPQCGRS
jgi:hypothetical protein